MSQFFIILVLLMCIGSVIPWVINNIDKVQLVKHFDPDLDNELGSDDWAHQRLALIYPGTKWCGAGDVAENYDDLGTEVETDKCCREHDFCPDYIEAGEVKNNLTNEAFYTRLACECDEKFRLCLRKANSRTANSIGTVYFNGLGTQCFRLDYPQLGCIKKGGWLKRKCLQYKYDSSAEKLYQWFDVKNY